MVCTVHNSAESFILQVPIASNVQKSKIIILHAALHADKTRHASSYVILFYGDFFYYLFKSCLMCVCVWCVDSQFCNCAFLRNTISGLYRVKGHLTRADGGDEVTKRENENTP